MNSCSHCRGETTEMDSNIFTFRRIIRKREQTMVLCENCRYEYKWDYEEEGWICDDDRDDRNDESNNQNEDEDDEIDGDGLHSIPKKCEYCGETTRNWDINNQLKYVCLDCSDGKMNDWEYSQG